MQITEEIKQFINSIQNVYIIPGDEPEAQLGALALFYTLKESGKNVNVLLETLPENLKFLAPSLDFISYPKNFVISVPKNIAEISQVYYEKSDENLKIHLAIDKGQIKKDDISFYFSEAKPDAVITIGIKDYQQYLAQKLNSFGFLLESPVLNIDSMKINEQENKKFGKINLVELNSFSEIIYQIALAQNIAISQPLAQCLLTGVILYTANFKSDRVTAELFEMSGQMMKKGADLKEIIEHIYH